MDQGANMVHNRYMTANCTGIIHVVKEGDTLYKIGKMHGVSVSALMYANPYVNIYNLQVGDELCVPVYNMSWNGGKEPRTGANAGQPQNMQSRTHYDDLIGEIRGYFAAKTETLRSAAGAFCFISRNKSSLISDLQHHMFSGSTPKSRRTRADSK